MSRGRKPAQLRNNARCMGAFTPMQRALFRKPAQLRNNARCMGVNATLLVLQWAKRRIGGLRLVVDPFCGAGTTLAVANFLGLQAVGVDLSSRRVRQAAALDVSELLAREGRAAESP